MTPKGTLNRSGYDERVADREAHVGIRELRDRRTVAEFDHRMDDRLRVDDHVDVVVADTEQLVRLDHFEALVHQRRGVDRDLRAHFPVRVRERLLDGDVSSSRRELPPEGSPARGDQEAGDTATGCRGTGRAGRVRINVALGARH